LRCQKDDISDDCDAHPENYERSAHDDLIASQRERNGGNEASRVRRNTEKISPGLQMNWCLVTDNVVKSAYVGCPKALDDAGRKQSQRVEGLGDANVPENPTEISTETLLATILT